MTVFFGERDRSGGQLRASALMDRCTRRSIATSVLLRGSEGFGAKHAARTDRLLTLSEDLPMALVAIDSWERIAQLESEFRGLTPRGLVTIEDARLIGPSGPGQTAPVGSEAAKLTVIVGRRERANGSSAHQAAVECMRANRMYCATALLGLDGTRWGDRHRARFFGRNEQVPMMIIGVGEEARALATLQDLSGALRRPALMLQPVRICSRDGARLAGPGTGIAGNEGSPRSLCRLTVYAAENVRHEHGTLHSAIVRRMRVAGAAGVSTLRGQWGYDGDGPPGGERIAALGRHAPMITMVVDTPQAAEGWLEIVEEMTGEGVLVTSEAISAGP